MGEGQVPKDCKKICAHFFSDVKHDGRNEDRLVADRHVTDAPMSSD